MKESRDLLEQLGYPSTDLKELPTSTKTFPDGAQYRIELPSVEGPVALKETLKEIDRLGLTIHRISQGSGIMLQTDEEIKEMCEMTAERGMELSLFVGPRGSWDVSAGPLTPGGKSQGIRHEGADQLVYAMEDLKRGAALGLRGALVADEGLLLITKEMKKHRQLPEDFVVKVSVQMGSANPVSVKLMEDIGANTYNVPPALTLSKLAAIRLAIDIPIDLYVEVPDTFGGFLRYYEIPEIIRVLAPVYIKFGLRNHPDVYPSGKQWESTNISLAHERVRRAAIGIQMIERYYPEAKTSKLGAEGLGIAKVEKAAAK
ncbi:MULTISPECIES: U32 family peptidase [unclassified Peribacillus]|uniref:U32 family peptidase n=1 Tax=unclassified Peribacillus TaxID=2675266 RepID=UPI0019146ACB|nr:MULTISPECIES: U32 family peptidase [unclassified Peribacillus]MBK5441999.1 U32 family peptidase [Peribacillus sp. TH24]WMX53598.1 U32 family peptidase [Peribacillus sp. R9-11]